MTATALNALASAGGLTPNSWYVAANSGVRYWASDAFTLRADALWSDSSGTALVRPDGSIQHELRVSDSSGRMLYGNSGPYQVTALQSRARTTPVFVRRRQGVMPYISAFQGAVGYDGRVVAVNTSGTFYEWTAAGGWEIKSSVGVLTGTVSVWFVDSRGYHFYGASTANALSRSTDHGATWSASLTYPDADDRPAPICEDELGNLYAGAYGSGSAGANSGTVWKSTDGGANWTQIGASDITPNVQRHIHGCWWDAYRSLLFVTCGDAGTTSDVYISDDRGVTFTRWTNSSQVTAMAFTAEYVLMAADTTTDRRIYRASGDTIAALTATTPAVCWDWIMDGASSTNGSTVHGFAWQGITDESGNVVFPFGSEGTRTAVMASSDGGDTWEEVFSGAAAGRTFHDFVQVSRYNTTRDGWQYGQDTTPSTDVLWQWRVYAPGQVLPVAYSATYSTGGGIDAAPLTELIDQGQRAPGIVQRLTADYSPAAIVTMPYAVIDPDRYALGSAVLTYPSAVEQFDGVTAPTLPSGWTTSAAGTGSTPVTSAAQYVTGPNSLLCVATAGSGNSQVRLTTAPWTLVQGDTAWLSASFYATAINTVRCDLVEFNSIRIGLIERESVKRLEVANLTTSVIFTQALPDAVPYPENAWVRVKVAITLAPNTSGQKNGRVRIWQDIGAGYVLVVDVIGTPTYNSLSQNLWVGINQSTSGPATSVYIDRFMVGLTDPERPPAYLLTGTQQAVIGGASR